MSRVVTILQKDSQKDIDMNNNAVRAFELGRVRVRDVCVAPANTAAVLRWLARILTHNVRRDERVGMALSGGGMEGFLYQIGVLHALHNALTGRDLRSIQTYTGVSSGSIGAAIMAAGVPTSEVIKAMHAKSEILGPLNGSMLFDLAGKSIAKRLLVESVTWAGLDPAKWSRKLLQSIPTGFFKGEGLKQYFKRAIEAYGYEDSFASLADAGVELYIGATDQDSFEHVTFGRPPWLNVPVSEALRASCALPPFFTPAQINNRWFIDGQVTKTVNIELVVERGCRLIFIIDPLKPLATLIPGSVDHKGGVFAMIQTIKALVHTRFQSTLTHMTERYPDVDFMVFQPDEECAQLMAGSPMRYRIRTQVVTAAYRHTLRQLRERHHVYSTKLGRYGFVLKPPHELRELEKDSSDPSLSVA
jgi:predicted acylesterase/phospholipase RssA